jgi:hypothetical protein
LLRWRFTKCQKETPTEEVFREEEEEEEERLSMDEEECLMRERNCQI